MSRVIDVDIAIVGGGIAGLWLLSRLRALGYGALLIESERLGTGQTIRSQGIIHGGTKYALDGELTEAARALGAMPEVWRRCLQGEGDVDLSQVKVLADHQYLCTAPSPASRLLGFFASKVMKSRMESVADVDFPAVLRDQGFRGRVYRLDEPVLDTASLLQALAEPQREALLRNQGPTVQAPDGRIYLRSSERAPAAIQPRVTVFTAGAGNAAQMWAPMQIRPLHMVMMRGENLPGEIYLHCLGNRDTPRLTITTHRDAAGRTVWYLGGELAESGVERDPKQQINAARRELGTLLPWVDLREAQFSTLLAQRAEARQHGGRRPGTPGIFKMGSLIIAWPTKLAMAPILADEVISLLKRDRLHPRRIDLSALADWPRPEVASYPWDEEREWT